MNIIKVLHSWLNATALTMAAIGEASVTGMTGNLLYPTPAVALTDMTTACTRLTDAWNGRDNGNAGKQELKDATIALVALLVKQSQYVDGIAKGDAAKIISSGFQATSGEMHPSVIPDQAPAPKVESFEGGRIKLSAKVVHGATSYCWIIFTGVPFEISIVNDHLIMPAGNTGAIVVPAGGTHEGISGLDSLKAMHAGVIARNAAGMAAISPLVEFHTM